MCSWTTSHDHTLLENDAVNTPSLHAADGILLWNIDGNIGPVNHSNYAADPAAIMLENLPCMISSKCYPHGHRLTVFPSWLSIAHFLETQMGSESSKIKTIADGPELFWVPKKQNGYRQLLVNRHSFPPWTTTGLDEPWKCPRLLKNRLHSPVRQPEVAPKFLQNHLRDNRAKFSLELTHFRRMTAAHAERTKNSTSRSFSSSSLSFSYSTANGAAARCFWRWAMLSRLVFVSSETTTRATTPLHTFFVHQCQAKRNSTSTPGWSGAHILDIDWCVAHFTTAPFPCKLFLAMRSRPFWSRLQYVRVIEWLDITIHQQLW